jgi:hypothetical protein
MVSSSGEAQRFKNSPISIDLYHKQIKCGLKENVNYVTLVFAIY